ncbi:uncharacterized protein LOC120426584 [Culex pipiens pallens]|uniref:uncharacterized protein LOC120426584 n=1 Tax=Culex pipiens pallens TaxID=42434 RepID=UPI0022AA8340|nr:uncharacterized protein LOC120426584 [Culex pipiens pallens]
MFHLKNLLCPSCPTLEIFFSVTDSPYLEQLLVEIVRNSSVAVEIITDPQLFQDVSRKRWSFAVLLLDRIPTFKEFMRYDSGIRTIAIVRDELFEELLDALIYLDVYHVLYLVYDAEPPIRYYDRFQRKLFRFDNVDIDLFRESDKNMMGAKFGVLDDDPDKRGQSEQKLLLSVLSDPFDRFVWTSNFCSVFGLALFVKFVRDHKIRWTRVCDLFVKLLGVGLMGSLIQLRNGSERFTVGLYMLTSIVLVSAYQSLVISFLLSTRYYPELDTLQQVNSTCRWTESDDNYLLRDAGFLHYGECNDDFPDDVELAEQIQSYYEQKCCMELSENIYETYFHAFAKHFRLSKLVTRQIPVFAGLNSISPLHDTVRWFATVFHEANLYYFVEKDGYQDPTVAKRHKLEVSPVTVQDLSLVWILYSLGVAIWFLVQIFEDPRFLSV